jgi:hypothetical protein
MFTSHALNIQLQTGTFAQFVLDFRNAHGSFPLTNPFLT